MSWVSTEFGSQLQTKDGVKSTSDVLAGKKRIGIYFGAHWCPPCRAFIPMLSDFYKQLNAQHGDDFEIVFVSADRDAESFAEYFDTMPFVALPFDSREINSKLASKYKVSGIPTRIIIDTSGKVIDTGGRTTVSRSSGNIGVAVSKWYE